MSKRIGIISGSLREGSFTTQIARAAKELFPASVEVEFIQIGQLPLFNQDFDDKGTTPESYKAFRSEIAAYDGFLFATPEHNRSFPAALTNALDVASRPWGHNLWNGKAAAIVSVSPGAYGGFGANHHLRQVLAFLNMRPVQQPEAYIGSVTNLLDGKGSMNEQTKAHLKGVVDALVSLL